MATLNEIRQHRIIAFDEMQKAQSDYVRREWKAIADGWRCMYELQLETAVDAEQ